MIILAYFFSGVFCVNAVPHFVQGISGAPFQSPFASPPGKGESSPVVNVLWGISNFIAGYAMLAYAGFFTLGINTETASWLTGGVSMSVILARYFGKVREKP